MADKKSFKCTNCGTVHPFGVYVAAHWNETLVHTCDVCGAKHAVRRGLVAPVKAGKKPKKVQP